MPTDSLTENDVLRMIEAASGYRQSLAIVCGATEDAQISVKVRNYDRANPSSMVLLELSSANGNALKGATLCYREAGTSLPKRVGVVGAEISREEIELTLLELVAVIDGDLVCIEWPS